MCLSTTHVCLITSSYPADYSRFLDREAVSLARAGFKVTIIGLGTSSRRFYFKGVKVIAVPEQRGFKKLNTLREISCAALREKADIYHCIDPWCLAIGFQIKAFCPWVKIIYESSEWFPQQYIDRNDLPRLLRAVGWLIVNYLEYRGVRKAAAIIETNRLRSLRFQRRKAPVHVIPNYAPLIPLSCHQLADSDSKKRSFIYTGLICRPRGFDRLLIALTEVKKRFPEVQLLVRGEFDPRDDIEQWVNNYIRSNNLQDNIRFLPRVDSYEQILEILGSALCGLILLQPQRGNDWTNQPSKLFEFMVAGLAVIASNFPEIRRIVNAANCGWLVDPVNPQEIARVMVQVLSDPERARQRGAAGREAAEKWYNWQVAEELLLKIYRDLRGMKDHHDLSR